MSCGRRFGELDALPFPKGCGAQRTQPHHTCKAELRTSRWGAAERFKQEREREREGERGRERGREREREREREMNEREREKERERERER